MTVNEVAWFIAGGLVGSFISALVVWNVAIERNYVDEIDYYDLDPVEINTPTYSEMKLFEDYDNEELW